LLFTPEDLYFLFTCPAQGFTCAIQIFYTIWFKPAEPNFFSKFGFSRLHAIFFHSLDSAGSTHSFSYLKFSRLQPNYLLPAELWSNFFPPSFSKFSRLNSTFFSEFSQP